MHRIHSVNCIDMILFDTNSANSGFISFIAAMCYIVFSFDVIIVVLFLEPHAWFMHDCLHDCLHC